MAETHFFYANAVDVSVSPFDVNLRFVKNTFKRAENNTSTVVELESQTITMSPSHAKAMLPALVNAVRDFEKQFGTLGLTPDMQKLFEETFPTTTQKS